MQIWRYEFNSFSWSAFRGDCLDVMPLAVPDRSVNLILADLPYGSTSCPWDSIIPLGPMWAEYARVLAPGGCILLFGDMAFAATLITSNRRWYSHDVVWDKNKCGSPGLAKYRPMRTHEFVLCFAPGRYTYNPQMEEGEPYTRKPPKQIRCNHHGYGFAGTKAEGIENKGTRFPKSVRRVSRDFSAQQQIHPTQKPVPFLRWLIRSYSNPGAMVLDNSAGVMSSGVAAIHEGRSYIGIERDECIDRKRGELVKLNYFKPGCERLAAAAAIATCEEAAAA
ncbi:site-specific DNA-methyltransferase [Uliginosibacterium sediminicola]|uniref:Methyltransferase n=1 Tax=Uliginosibacterium sediminicola TaxID=2024550 RepID=A0ABU9YWG5_9RHOO